MAGKLAQFGALGILCTTLALNMGGCPSASCDAGNPASVLGAALKVVNCQMSELVPCELQVLAKTVSDLSPDVEINLPDAEAAAAVAFLKENNVKCLADLEALIQQAQDDPSSIVIPDSLQKIIDSGVDVGSFVTQG